MPPTRPVRPPQYESRFTPAWAKPLHAFAFAASLSFANAFGAAYRAVFGAELIPLDADEIVAAGFRAARPCAPDLGGADGGKEFLRRASSGWHLFGVSHADRTQG